MAHQLTLSSFFFVFSQELQKLESLDWDLIISDEFSPNLCQRAITRSLSKPYVLWNIMLPPAVFHDDIDIPHPPSFYPAYSYSQSDLKSFSQRFYNFISHLLILNANKFTDFLIRSSNRYHLYTTKNFAAKSLMTLTQWPLELDFVYPQSHRLIYSNFECPIRLELTPDWKSFVERTESNGTILLSFGHLIYWDFHLLKGFFAAAEKFTNISFIWHLRIPQSLPHFELKNVRMGSWLPLDALLNHPKTLLLVSHAAAKSLFGGICTGVPLLGIPHQFDQFRIAARINGLKIGKVLDRHSLTTQQIINAISDMVETKKYSKRIRNLRGKMLDKITQGITEFHLQRAFRRNSSLTLFHSIGGRLDLFQYYSLDMFILCFAASALSTSVNYSLRL